MRDKNRSTKTCLSGENRTHSHVLIYDFLAGKRLKLPFLKVSLDKMELETACSNTLFFKSCQVCLFLDKKYFIIPNFVRGTKFSQKNYLAYFR